MGWTDKASVNDVLLYCETWKTRNQIRARFDMTPIESWHCVKYISKLNYCVETVKNRGWTNRAHEFRTRAFEIENIKREREEKNKQ